MNKQLTPEQEKKIKKSQNIVLIVLVFFVLLNIGIFMWFLMSQRP
ncbi:MAG TPA: hypothetical protein P5060_03200 [Candidatus Absconditabacterales bacterium]|nr:hypothetical protein [Candidatus Absconditabacterales bacterium]